jgi:hypothetical protein
MPAHLRERLNNKPAGERAFLMAAHAVSYHPNACLGKLKTGVFIDFTH